MNVNDPCYVKHIYHLHTITLPSQQTYIQQSSHLITQLSLRRRKHCICMQALYRRFRERNSLLRLDLLC